MQLCLNTRFISSDHTVKDMLKTRIQTRVFILIGQAYNVLPQFGVVSHLLQTIFWRSFFCCCSYTYHHAYTEVLKLQDLRN